MPTTEFLLYLVIVIFAVFVIMNYYRTTPTELFNRDKYSSNYKESGDNRRSTGNEYMDDVYTSERQGTERRSNGNGGYTGDKILNIDVNTKQGSSQQSQSQHGPGYGPGYGSGYGPGHGSGYGPGPGIGLGPVPPIPPVAPVPPIDPLRKFDYDAVSDEFTPPFRRSYYDDNNYLLVPGLYPTYTRGPPGRFRKIGTLVAEGVSANDKYKFMLLMGRQKYPRGNDYEYYASSADSEQNLKFYICTKGKEIHDEDIVRISELEGYLYRFREDQDLSPRYDPYLI